MRIDSSSILLFNSHNEVQNSSALSTQTATQVHTLASVQESEALNVIAQGIVKTMDGKTITLSQQSSLARFDSYKLETWQDIPIMTDPLVISLDGKLASVDKTETFSFDINRDGKNEDISLLEKNSGFLALDLNGNGKIDNGSELFGTKSGDGFADLSAYDEDGNGWIDENDSVFSKLMIWQKNALQDQLMTLNQAKVGALLLDSTDSNFTYRNGADNNAALKKSSVVLFEDGKSGWMSHLDFAITPPASSETQKSNNQTTTSNNNALSPFTVSKLKANSTSSDSHSLVETLNARLKILQKRLSKTTSQSEKDALMLQIMKLSMQIAELGG